MKLLYANSANTALGFRVLPINLNKLVAWYSVNFLILNMKKRKKFTFAPNRLR